MKKVIGFLFAGLVLLSSTCKKGVQIPDPELKKIFGKWEWISTSGGFAGKIVTPAKAGYSERIEFNNEGIYQKYKNDNLVDRKKFSVSKQTSIRNQDETWVISFVDDAVKFNESPLPMAITFEGMDTLMLNEEVHDGFGYVYARIK